MHIYFSGIGGAGIGPLALVAKQAGYEVSGSDQQDSQYIDYLRKHGINNIHIGQNYGDIALANENKPIDWLVHSSSVPQDNPELTFAREQAIHVTKRDGLLNRILDEKNLKLIAVAGTHGKTTTTAMLIWLLKELGVPVSYSVGAKLSFGDMGHYEPGSEYFIYEADEFDHNFLAFHPNRTIITGVSWDHHEIFPTREDYQTAFCKFINQSLTTYIWKKDADYLGLERSDDIAVLKPKGLAFNKISLKGSYNRMDAFLAAGVAGMLSGVKIKKVIELVNRFPGLSRRMEEIIPNLYSDYAHTPDKIRGAMSVALEMAAPKSQPVVVVYEPLTNRRQHYMIDDYQDCFDGAAKVYWLPSYLAREDTSQRIIRPEELISHLSDPKLGVPAQRNAELKRTIQAHLDKGDMVVGIAGGGSGSLDDWLRHEFGPKHQAM